MSVCAVYVWDPLDHGPLPATVEAAAAKVRELFDKRAGVGSSVLGFAQRMQDVVRLDPKAQASWLGCFGNLGKTAFESVRPVLTVELPHDSRASGLRMVAKTAKLFGLVVFDDEQGLAILPSGKILPTSKEVVFQTMMEAGHKAPASSSGGISSSVILSALEKLFHDAGFTIKAKDRDGRSALIRPVEGGHQYVCFELQPRSEWINVIVEIYMDSPSIEEIYNQFPFKKIPYLFFLNAHRLIYGVGASGAWQICGAHDFSTMLEQIRTIIVPALDSVVNLKSLDEILNEQIESNFSGLTYRSPRALKCVILRKIAGNVQNLERTIEVVGNCDWGPTNNRLRETEWPKLVEYIRNYQPQDPAGTTTVS